MVKKKIQEAFKNKKIIIGYRRSIRFLKFEKPELIVLAKNAPEHIKEDIKKMAKMWGVKVEMVESSKELGIICGKPFPITTLVIKG